MKQLIILVLVIASGGSCDVMTPMWVSVYSNEMASVYVASEYGNNWLPLEPIWRERSSTGQPYDFFGYVGVNGNLPDCMEIRIGERHWVFHEIIDEKGVAMACPCMRVKIYPVLQEICLSWRSGGEDSRTFFQEGHSGSSVHSYRFILSKEDVIKLFSHECGIMTEGMNFSRD